MLGYAQPSRGGRTGAASADADGPCPQRATGRRQPAADRTPGGGGSPRSAGSEASEGGVGGRTFHLLHAVVAP